MSISSNAITAPRRSFFDDLQLLIVILLGVVSVATAYVSFPAALYGGQQASAYSRGGMVGHGCRGRGATGRGR
ncbi:hypothetical protein [Microbacterium sp. bgisy207]|uniref:hypothetical protein n=1 Tax=Microbacterium sp. bgisy207 TaxID=3413800 RepID=UPI003EBA2571